MSSRSATRPISSATGHRRRQKPRRAALRQARNGRHHSPTEGRPRDPSKGCLIVEPDLSQVHQFGDAYLPALEIQLRRFLSTATRTIVEYGTGGSTALLIRLIDDIWDGKIPDDLVLLSIDHNEAYQRSVSASLPCRSYLHLRTYDLFGIVDTTTLAGVNYATASGLLRRPIDLAYVDGRTRAQCILFVGPRLRDGGAV